MGKVNKDISQDATQNKDERVGAHFLGLPQDNRKKIIRIIVLAAIAVAVGIIIAIAVGFLAISFKHPQERIVVSPNVCTSTVVQQFNDAVASRYSDVSQADNITPMRKVVDDFSKNKRSDKDPTCLFMKYRYAIVTSDYTTAKTALDQLERLAAEGLFVDGRVKGLVSFADMAQAVRLIAPKEEAEFDD